MIYSGITALLSLLFLIAGIKKINRKTSGQSPITDFIIAITLLLISITNGLFISAYKVPSESMVPVLNVGDYVIVDKYGLSGDTKDYVGKIVVYTDPRDNDVYVKRVVAKKGNHVSWDGNTLRVDQQEISVDKRSCTSNEQSKEEIYNFMSEDNVTGNWNVNSGIFTVGTNVCASIDSRSYGEIPLDNVIGIVISVCNEQGCHYVKTTNTQ